MTDLPEPVVLKVDEVIAKHGQQVIVNRDDFISYAKLSAMTEAYHAFWEPQHPAYRHLDTEKEVYVDLVNPDTGCRSQTWVLGGKLDKLAYDWHEQVDLIDHKTSAYDLSTDAYWQRLRTDTQNLHYAALATLSGLVVNAIVWDVVSKPRLKPKTDDELGSGDYRQRIIDTMLDNPDRYFARRSNACTIGEICDYLEKLWKDCIVLRERDRVHGNKFRVPHYHPQNFTACFSYNRPCEYFGICHEGQEPGPPYWEQQEKHKELDSLPDDMEVMTYSRHKCWMTCQRKHQLRYMERWGPIRIRDDEPLVFGSMWHDVMDAWWESQLEKEIEGEGLQQTSDP